MAVELPEPIASYFDADKGQNAERIAACFTPTAVVKDEGHTYTGRDAIRRWKDEASAKYTYSSEPFSIANEDGRVIVSSHLTGDFPGSPIDLRYVFTLDGVQISELEIKL
ncbi:hypothetical protein J2792_003889 [Novosphingobium capsulatum]|uniref:SnoaL-like domain-containing protein n=1 Tax=Novosphingobium capsulatum TaxID=13688 RepID=A0ABU1MRM6_9SPHN|nr:nuclear transport factor 2 family protein [Novosphingobium capsulatum]MDR6513001.1 hypothetical protein [Novosphingobium capsulatum]